MKKTILILVDGMRPDAVLQTGHKVVDELKAHSVYTLGAQTVMPSVTPSVPYVALSQRYAAEARHTVEYIRAAGETCAGALRGAVGGG